MRTHRFGSCCALAIAACFRETTDASSDGDDPASSTSVDDTGTGSSAATVTTTTSSATSSITDETTAGTDPPPDTSDGDDTVGTSSPPPDGGGGGNCHTLDFDGLDPICGAGTLSLALGPEEITFDEPMASPASPCIEDADDADGESAPLVQHYLSMRLFAGFGSTLSFSAPVASLAFTFGPHGPEGVRADLSICTSLSGKCVEATATADQTSPATLELDLGGSEILFIVVTEGAPVIGLDEVQVCFE